LQTHPRCGANGSRSAVTLQSFYETGAKNRRLQWIYGLGSCTLKGNFDAKPVELVCSTTFHAAVLLQFNTGACKKAWTMLTRFTHMAGPRFVSLQQRFPCLGAGPSSNS